MFVREIIHTQTEIFEMINDDIHLIIRSKSRFISVWFVNECCWGETTDSMNEVVSMTYKHPYIITCDINNEIR